MPAALFCTFGSRRIRYGSLWRMRGVEEAGDEQPLYCGTWRRAIGGAWPLLVTWTHSADRRRCAHVKPIVLIDP